MTIGQVIKLAQNGKLKDLAVAKDVDSVLGYINLGLIELYKRFPLKVEEYIITLVDGKTIYDMPDNYMWIVSAYQEVPELVDMPYDPIPVNVEDNPASLNTIGFNQVQIPVTTTGAYISVIYVSAPPFIEYDSVNDKYTYIDTAGSTVGIVNVPVPPQMIEALLEYTAYEANNTFDENGKLVGDSYYQKFENSCVKIEHRGMISSDDLDMAARDMKGMP